jgi:hypothetical protein
VRLEQCALLQPHPSSTVRRNIPRKIADSWAADRCGAESAPAGVRTLQGKCTSVEFQSHPGSLYALRCRGVSTITRRVSGDAELCMA